MFGAMLSQHRQQPGRIECRRLDKVGIVSKVPHHFKRFLVLFDGDSNLFELLQAAGYSRRRSNPMKIPICIR